LSGEFEYSSCKSRNTSNGLPQEIRLLEKGLTNFIKLQQLIETARLNKIQRCFLQENTCTRTRGEIQNVTFVETGFTGRRNFIVVRHSHLKCHMYDIAWRGWNAIHFLPRYKGPCLIAALEKKIALYLRNHMKPQIPSSIQCKTVSIFKQMSRPKHWRNFALCYVISTASSQYCEKELINSSSVQPSQTEISFENHKLHSVSNFTL
jgi:hypothetical protein